MKKLFKTSSIILLISIPLLSLAEDNTLQSFNQSKNQDKQKALSTIPNPENIKMFKDLIKDGPDKLQTRLENILKDKENYPQVADEIKKFKTKTEATIIKFKSKDVSLSKVKQINVKNILGKGIFKTLDKKIEKLESADTKVSQKISLLIASNVDASSTTNLLLEAEKKLTIAKSAVKEVESQINLAVSSEGGVSSDAIKTSATDANNKILEAINAYKITLESISLLPKSTEPKDDSILFNSDQASSTNVEQSSTEATSTEIDQTQDKTSTTSVETQN
ncbi:MAG: hypothetical protein WCF92_01210 [bacterium]